MKKKMSEKINEINKEIGILFKDFHKSSGIRPNFIAVDHYTYFLYATYGDIFLTLRKQENGTRAIELFGLELLRTDNKDEISVGYRTKTIVERDEQK